MGDTKADWDFVPPSTGCSTSSARDSFAAGASRRAYRAMRWKPASKYGRKAVVKEYKDTYTWAQGDWDTAVKTYEKAKELAKKFNRETSFPVHVVDYDVQQVISNPDKNATPKLGEFVLVEDYLEGEFQKFISNSGWVSPRCQTYVSMPAFAHWSWVHTGGQLMFVDLQGVRYNDKYMLTDPCILSLNREYGATDLALVGMALFFKTHKCNDFCSQLNIQHKRPNLTGLLQFLNQEFGQTMQTSYLSRAEYEKLPLFTRQKIRAVLSYTFSQFCW